MPKLSNQTKLKSYPMGIVKPDGSKFTKEYQSMNMSKNAEVLQAKRF